MARCRCAETGCNCQLTAGEYVTVSGLGTPAAPWVVNATPVSRGTVAVADTETLDLEISGAGTEDNPYVISGNTASVPGGIVTGYGITGTGSDSARCA